MPPTRLWGQVTSIDIAQGSVEVHLGFVLFTVYKFDFKRKMMLSTGIEL